METEIPLYNDFDWSLLDSPEFKEDSVREELIAPLLNRMGYSASWADRILRSKAVKHPFVYLGSKSHRIELIPDYLLEVENKFRWVLDAKGPTQNTITGKNAQQAYSYAIHPEIRVRYFALCNGRQFTVFDIHQLAPILDFPLCEVHEHWDRLVGLLAPEQFRGVSENLNPDLGLHFHRLDMDSFEKISFVLMAIPMIGRVSESHFTTGGQYSLGEDNFCASFDFHSDLLPQLVGLFPRDARRYAEDKLSRAPFMADLRSYLPHVNITCKMGKKVEATHNHSEQFCPFEVLEFS